MRVIVLGQDCKRVQRSTVSVFKCGDKNFGPGSIPPRCSMVRAAA